MKLFSYWKILVSLVVVVVCSALIGAGVALRVQNHRMARTARGGLAVDLSADRLSTALGLTPEQQARMRPLLERNLTEIRTITATALTQGSQVAGRFEQELRPLLTAEQLQRYQQLVERRRRMLERWRAAERLTPEQREWLRERIEQRFGGRPNAEAPR